MKAGYRGSKGLEGSHASVPVPVTSNLAGESTQAMSACMFVVCVHGSV